MVKYNIFEKTDKNSEISKNLKKFLRHIEKNKNLYI